jgi:hypothetical protein
MFDEFKRYIYSTRLKLEKLEMRDDIPLDMLMEEISGIAVYNWVSREDGTPDLTEEQINSAINRVIARKYSRN